MNKCLERVNDRHFWNPAVFSYAMTPRCCPNSFFFFIVTSIVYAYHTQLGRTTDSELIDNVKASNFGSQGNVGPVLARSVAPSGES
jgi:hypothetical protein